MTSGNAWQLLTQAPFVLVFLAVVRRAWHQRVRANFDMTIFFAAIAVAVALQYVALVTPHPAVRPLTWALEVLTMALPYLLLRLVDDFSGVPSWLARLAEVGLLVAAAGLLLTGLTGPRSSLPWVLFAVVYFVTLVIYSAVRFFRESRRSRGVTSRRLQAVALGSVALGLVILSGGLTPLLPRAVGLGIVLSRVFALGAGLCYFIGFAPPAWLRRAWQEPELREFLGRVARLPWLGSTAAIVEELRNGAARILGAPDATIGLWDPDTRVLRYAGAEEFDAGSGSLIGGRAFTTGRAVFSSNAPRDDPDNAALYRQRSATAILAAPIAAGGRRLGVLAILAPRAPLFVEDDLELVQLLAGQAAVILESRELIDEAARVRALEHAARLKDDFLSSAAHDLKTPLTTLLAQAQLLERRALRRPDEPADLAGIRRIVHESDRLHRIVLELLDASRLKDENFAANREAVDLVQLAREASEDQTTARHRCTVEADGQVVGCYDRGRIKQLLENLIENGVKFSPAGGAIVTRVWTEGGEARIDVSDSGIGIPEADLPYMFSRYHRGANVDDRRFAGMGLGLSICRSIVEQHGGRIWADSRFGRGSTVHVALPLGTTEARHD